MGRESNKGKFIVFEGADYTGKSTVAEMTVRWLNELGIPVILTKHPGSTGVGQELRKISKHSTHTIPPITEALINAAANSAFIDLVLVPAIDNGTWVIGDRNNYISSLVYQVQSGVTMAALDRVHDATYPNPPKIDTLFILQASDEQISNRKENRTNKVYDRYENEEKYAEGVRSAYDVLAREHQDRLKKFVKTTETEDGEDTPLAYYVDANVTPEESFAQVKEMLVGLLPRRKGSQAQA